MNRWRPDATRLFCFVLLCGFYGAMDHSSSTFAADAKESLQLTIRKKTETEPGSGRFHTLKHPAAWEPLQTAIIVCDMWDLHHCLNATRRGAEMGPRMNRVLKTARDRGVTIIHAPSSCMDFYKDHPARLNATSIPLSQNLPEEIGAWCHQIPSEEQGEYPIDQSDGGEDDDPAEHAEWAQKLQDMGRDPRKPWKRQTELLEIRNEDFISDSGEEIWSILERRRIDNVILLGVHTNMCVLGRPFGLRQMAKNGKNVVLMRDMTDTMYNPARAPYVSHFTGTDLIIDHIEKYVCPTITSDQFLGDKPFRFENDHRPHLVIISAEREYETERTLPQFALQHLGQDFRVSFVFGNANERNDLPGIDVLNDANLVLVSVRRRVLPTGQLQLIQQFVSAGKPVIGIRTASHAFCLRNEDPPEGLFAWPEFDHDIFGGSYTNHHGKGPRVNLEIAETAGDHSILDGIDTSAFNSAGSLYKVSPLSGSTVPLLVGSIPDKSPEPVAWINKRPNGGRTFYTSLGHPEDFEQPEFNKFLRNAVYWAAELPVPH